MDHTMTSNKDDASELFFRVLSEHFKHFANHLIGLLLSDALVGVLYVLVKNPFVVRAVIIDVEEFECCHSIIEIVEHLRQVCISLLHRGQHICRARNALVDSVVKSLCEESAKHLVRYNEILFGLFLVRLNFHA